MYRERKKQRKEKKILWSRRWREQTLLFLHSGEVDVWVTNKRV